MPEEPSLSNASSKTSPPEKRDIEKTQETGSAPLWVLIVGFIFLALAVLFFMGLIVASLLGFTVPDGSRFLVCIVLALTVSIATGFLGGSAVASGQLKLPLLDTPFKVGVTGGIAVFLITLFTCHTLYNASSPPPRAPSVTSVETSTRDDTVIVSVSFENVTLPAQHSMYVEISTDPQFAQPARSPFPITDSNAGSALISLPRSSGQTYWLRFVVKTSEGKTVATGNSWQFKPYS